MSEQSNGVRYKNSGNCSLPVWFLTFPFTFRILNLIISEMLNVHKIFRGRKEMSEEDMRSGTVVGGAVALAEKLKADHSWDGRTLLAAPIAVLEMGAIVDNFWSVLGELKDVSFGASTLWARGDKELRVAIKLEDLKVFNFKGGERERNGGNLSEWLSREDLGAGEVTFTKVDGTEVNFEEATELHGVSEFSIRLLVVPTSHKGANIWVGACPYSRAELRTKLGNDGNSHMVPHITLPIKAAVPHGVNTASRAEHAVLSRQELPNDGWGFGCIPWLDITADGEEGAMLPTSDELKEAALCQMRQSATSAATTTPTNVEARMVALVEGRPAAPLRNFAHVFPEFTPGPVNGDPPGPVTGKPRTGWLRMDDIPIMMQ